MKLGLNLANWCVNDLIELMLRYICLIFFVLFSQSLKAQPLQIAIDGEPRRIGHEAWYLPEKDQIFERSLVLQGKYDAYFTKESQEVANFSGRSEAVWMRLDVQNVSEMPLGFELTNTYIDTLDLYVPIGKGRYQQIRTGQFFPFSSRAEAFRYFILPVQPPANGDSVFRLYVRFTASSAHFWLPLKMGSLKKLELQNRHTEFIYLAFMCILLAMFFYNMGLAIMTRDLLYLAYLGYVLTALFYLVYYSGYAFEWFEGWNWSAMNVNIPIALVYLGFIPFTNMLFQIRKQFPVLFMFAIPIFLVSVLMLFSAWLPEDLPNTLIDIVNLAYPVYIIAAAYKTRQNDKKLSNLFLLAWLPLMLGAAAYTFLRNGWMYNDWYQVYGIAAAMAWEAVLFSLILGYRYNRMRLETIRLQDENLKLLNDSRSFLEKEVEVQTQELRQQQGEIIRQKEQLELQNKELAQSKSVIDGYNRELEDAVRNRTLELALANQELKDRVHQLEQFSFITAHNLRSPVARILGLSQWLEPGNYSAEDKTWALTQLIQSTKDLDEVVHDLGRILAVQRNRKVQMEWFDVGELLHSVLEKFEAQKNAQTVTLDVEIAVQQVYSVPGYWLEILENLIGNAFKFLDPGRPARISIRILAEGKHLIVKVEDNGKGFNFEKYQPKVGEPFQRFHVGTPGKGLGLFLVKSEVTALEGEMRLSSAVGLGTQVEIRIPSAAQVNVPV